MESLTSQFSYKKISYQYDEAYGSLPHSPCIAVYYSCNKRIQGSLHESCISGQSLKRFFWCCIVMVKMVCWKVERMCSLTFELLEMRENWLFLRQEAKQWCQVWRSLGCDYTVDTGIFPKVGVRLSLTIMVTWDHYHPSFSQVSWAKFLPKSIDSIKFWFPNILIDGWWNIFEKYVQINSYYAQHMCCILPICWLCSLMGNSNMCKLLLIISRSFRLIKQEDFCN